MNIQEAIEWLFASATPRSPQTAILYALLSAEKRQAGKRKMFPVPRTVSDFARCASLVERCQITGRELREVAAALPWWKPYTDQWDSLTALLRSGEFTELKRLIGILAARSDRIRTMRTPIPNP